MPWQVAVDGVQPCDPSDALALAKVLIQHLSLEPNIHFGFALGHGDAKTNVEAFGMWIQQLCLTKGLSTPGRKNCGIVMIHLVKILDPLLVQPRWRGLAKRAV